MMSRSSLSNFAPGRWCTIARSSAFRLRAGMACSVLALLCATHDAPARTEGVAGHATRLNMTADEKARETLAVVTFTHTPAYIARFSDEKKRLIVDVVDAGVRGLSETYSRSVGIVKSVMTQAFDTPKSKTTRLLFSLSEPATAAISVSGRQLTIRFSPLGEAAPGKEPAPSNAAPAAATAGAQTPPAAPPAPKAKPGGPAVSDVAYDHQENSDWIRIRAEGYSSFEEEHPGPGRSRLVIKGIKLDPELERTLDVRAFGGRVQSVTSSYDAKRRAVIVDVERKDALRSFVSEQEGQLSWSFFAPGDLHPSVTGVGSDGGVARKARTLHVDEAVAAGLPLVDAGDSKGETAEQTTSDTEEVAGFGPSLLGQQGYSGRRMDLDFKDIDIHNVLRLLADVGQVNIITADNVSGFVTIKMKNVPWDQALDVVLQSKGLGMVRQGNIIRVAPLAQLEKEREMAIARRRQELQLAPLETRLIPVSYASAEELQQRAQEVLSSRGSIAVDGRTNVLIARDVTGTLDQVEELIRSLDTQTPQVLVEARIVEATSRYLRDLGIQWGGDASFSAATGNPTGLAFPSSIGLTGGASDNDTPTAGLSPFQAAVQNPNFAVNLPATVGAGSGGALGLTLGSVDSNFNLNLRLSAAEQTGMVRILSSPRILTLDNHEARISQGTLIPFSQVSAQGVQTTFQEAKLQLLVQPHVTADGSVAMHVKINRDEPDFNQTSARGDPTILKREAETDLLVMDGHTAVIGGIYTRNTGKNVDQVPFFGDIPLLGLLFQRRRSTDQRGELVIFLTPRIVNRAQALGR